MSVENKLTHPFLGMIRDMEAQMEAMNRTLAGLKQQKKQVVPHKHKEKREKPMPVASTSKATPKANGKKAVGGAAHKKNTKRPITDDDVLSFEQKKQLSDAISNLDGTKLEKVIQIIHEGVPEIRDVSIIVITRRLLLLITISTEH